MPKNLRDATISLFKDKGSKADCGNYWAISLLPTAEKFLAHIILNHQVTSISEENLPNVQCGFHPGHSTIDMVCVVCQVQEKCIEQNLDLYALFIDLAGAFDTVNREDLWTILSKFGCPRNRFVKLICLFHDNMIGLIHTGGETFEPFEVSNGVKQGCMLVPLFFNLILTCLLSHAVRDLGTWSVSEI